MEGSQFAFTRRSNQRGMHTSTVWLRIRIHVFLVLFLFLYMGAEIREGASSTVYSCGEEPSSVEGDIQSPNYPGRYPNNAACKWHFNLETGQILTLSFKDFSLVGRGNCRLLSGDSLEIAPSISSDYPDNSPRRVTYCHSTLPPPYISDEGTQTLVITFLSDRSLSSRGFVIEYFKGERYSEYCNYQSEFHCRVGNCIPLGWRCNGMNECSDGSDELPQFCQVSTPRHTSAPVHASTPVHTPVPVQCPPHTFSCQSASTNNHVCLSESLKCNGHIDCADEMDEYDCKCVQYLKGTSGYFESPNFPNQYDANLNCSWYLTIDKGDLIQLRFDVFDLEQQYNTDFVTVYDVDENNQLNKIGTFYGYMQGMKKSVYMPPTVINGKGNQLKVVLHTDSRVSGRGFNATYQTKGNCLVGQTRCSVVDANCFDDKERCDNHMSCLKGQDELGCSVACGPDKIPCFRSSKGCFSLDKRCNGKNDCSLKEDEKHCSTQLCNTNRGLFCCRDGTCIQEKYTCDSSPDCQFGEDEENCIVTINIVTAATVGSIICGLLLVAALSCTCKLYQLRIRERLPPSHVSPLREIEEELLRREAPPSYTATMASPHFDEAQQAFIEGIQAAMIARNESRSAGRNDGGNSRRSQRGTLVRMLSRDRNTRSAEQSQVEADENTTESQTETLPPSPDDAEGIDNEASTATVQDEISENENDPPPLQHSSDDQSAPIACLSSVEASPQSTTRGQQEESASSSVSDTDSETNIDALQLDLRDQQLLRATANIRRMRLVGGLQNILQAQEEIAARSRSRTDSLGDSEGTELGPNTDINVQPEAVSEGESPQNTTTNRSSDQDPTTSKQVTTDETKSANNSPPHPDPQPLSTESPQRENTPPPSDVNSHSPKGQTNNVDESNIMKAEQESEDRLSQASSLLSIASNSSQKTGEDCEMLKL